MTIVYRRCQTVVMEDQLICCSLQILTGFANRVRCGHSDLMMSLYQYDGHKCSNSQTDSLFSSIFQRLTNKVFCDPWLFNSYQVHLFLVFTSTRNFLLFFKSQVNSYLTNLVCHYFCLCCYKLLNVIVLPIVFIIFIYNN